jgi:excisionase family DNA binding protein
MLDKHLYTVNETKDLLRISRTTLYRLMEDDAIPSVTQRGKRFFKADDISNYLNTLS